MTDLNRYQVLISYTELAKMLGLEDESVITTVIDDPCVRWIKVQVLGGDELVPDLAEPPISKRSLM